MELNSLLLSTLCTVVGNVALGYLDQLIPPVNLMQLANFI